MTEKAEAATPMTRAEARSKNLMEEITPQLEDGVYRSVKAIMKGSTGDEHAENLPAEITKKMESRINDELDLVERPWVNHIDAYTVVEPSLSAEDLCEILEDIAELHMGRPGECGPNCPALTGMDEEKLQ